MVAVGILVFAVAVGSLVWLVCRGPRQRPYPLYGYLGWLVILVAEVLTIQGRHLVGTFLTPIAWTGYIAAADGAVLALSGRSLLRSRPGEFLAASLLSVPLWLVFEAYNLRLRNWTYVGLPASPALRYFGYAWSFATIWPAILETSQLLRAAGLWRKLEPEGNRQKAVGAKQKGWEPGGFLVFVGAAMLAVPLLLPVRIAAYSFGLVWLGFIFLLEPINFRLGAPSLVRDLKQGQRARLYSLLVAGALCGILWEFWNYWAAAKWVYVFPILQGWKLFEMPLPGFLGFPPFAVEMFAMYCFLTRLAGHVPEL